MTFYRSPAVSPDFGLMAKVAELLRCAAGVATVPRVVRVSAPVTSKQSVPGQAIAVQS